jgi:ATP-binding cassette subfamily F protein 3
MLLASLQNVSKSYGAQQVLRDVSFRISSGQKAGLIGANGSGKTTILRLLVGKETPSSGNAVVGRGVRLGYVPQHVEYGEAADVMDCILAGHRQLAAALREKEQQLARASGNALDRAMRAYQRTRDEYDHAGGDRYPQRAEAMLDAMGLAGRARQKVGSLSGGERNVRALAEALLSEPDLLLLDEPANHLDYMGIAWLEDFLLRFKGAVLLVSHNRYLLDRIVGQILHLQGGRITPYEGNYSAYRANRLRHLIAQQEDYTANQKRLAQLEALVQRFAEIARGKSDPKWGRRLRARRKQLEREKAQAVEKPTLGPSAIRPDFHTRPVRANIALQLRGYSRAFGDLKLFDSVDLDIACGERVALVGPNGCGKTTLLRDMVELGSWENPTIRVGPSLTVGYCAQQQEVLQQGRTVWEEISSVAPLGRKEAYGILARFLFSPEDAEKRVRDLSGGERNRLQLARLMVPKPNFLILDEPTNHLDILAREAVEDALADYEGTLLVVSHDRYFLDKTVSRVVEVRNRRLHSYPGGFTDFWYARERLTARAVGRVSTRRAARDRAGRAGARQGSSDALERRVTEAEQQKVLLEQRIEKAFSRRDHREARRLARELEQLQARIDALYEEWLAANE